MTLTELLFQCPDPDCERGFDAEFKLNQHMDDTGHCECETLEEDWDDEVPSPDVRQVPPRQASKRTIRLAGEALAHPDQCGTCLLYTSPSPRDRSVSRMPSSA